MQVQPTLRKIFCEKLTLSGQTAYTELMSDFETTTPAGYITVEEAANTRTEAGTFWELHPDVTITLTEYSDEGHILDDIEVSTNAALHDLNVMTDNLFLVYGEENGERFQGEVFMDLWTPVRLVDAR